MGRCGRMFVCAVSVAVALAPLALAQSQTVGLFLHDKEKSFQGYTLFGPHNGTVVYLMDNNGLIVHEWETGYEPGLMGYLLPNGDLLRIGKVPGPTGVIQQFDWDGNILWEYVLDGSVYRFHHDIEPLPNGNVLMLGWETKTAAEAIAAGLDPAKVNTERWPEAIIELQPLPPNDAQIVWEWHTWDHLIQDFDPTKANFGDVGANPQLVDINFGEPNTPDHHDWMHSNGLAYNPDLDQIVMSVRNFSEFWVIDHSTTTAEAAGHTGGNSGKGGDLLYRWGNPASYRRGTAADRVLYFQHDSQWISPGSPGAGNFIVYNNGDERPEGDFSTIEEVAAPVDQNGNYTILPGQAFAPATATWNYTASPPESFFSRFISGVHRQPNGNTVICEGRSGHFFEVTPTGEIVWDYVNSVHNTGILDQGDPVPNSTNVFKVRRYPPDYSAFAGRDLTPIGPLEGFTAPFPINGSSLTASREATTAIRVGWSTTGCTSQDYHLIYGDLATVSEYDLSGAECNIGQTGQHMWIGVPPGPLYFMVVGTDQTGVYESSWGQSSSGDERNGYGASFECGTTTKIVTSTCP